MAIEVVPLNGFIGAEIRGADLARLDDAAFRALHDALVKYEVIVLRRQPITLEQQMAFGERFGELSIHPFSPNLEAKPEVIVLDYSADHQRRVMERVTITGDMPIGASGDYTPETVEGLGSVNPTGPAKKPPVRQFERGP